MRRQSQPVIALFLTGALLLGGVAGFSPLLHVWLEHGGRGPAHVHLSHHAPAGVEETVAESFHGPAAEPIRIAVPPAAVRAHTKSLPSFALARFWLGKFLHHLTEGAAPETEPPPEAHHHDSLAQTLIHGLIVLAVIAVLWLAAAGVSQRRSAPTGDLRLNPVLALLLPERAPPVALG